MCVPPLLWGSFWLLLGNSSRGVFYLCLVCYLVYGSNSYSIMYGTSSSKTRMPERMTAQVWAPSSEARIGDGSSVDMPHGEMRRGGGRNMRTSYMYSYRHELFAEMAS